MKQADSATTAYVCVCVRVRMGGLIEEKEEAFPRYQELLAGMCEKQGSLKARMVVASPLGVVRVV